MSRKAPRFDAENFDPMNLDMPVLRTGVYYWVIAQHRGRTLIIGPKTSEEDANRLGFEKLEGNFSVVELATRDRSKATAQIKARILNRTSDIDEATKRFRHKYEKEQKERKD